MICRTRERQPRAQCKRSLDNDPNQDLCLCLCSKWIMSIERARERGGGDSCGVP